MAIGQELLATSRHFGPLGFVFLGTILMCLFVPKTIISLAAGAVFGVLDGAWVLSGTALVSAMVNYHIGRFCLTNRHIKSVGQTLGTESLVDSSPGSARQRKRLLRLVGRTARDAGLGFHLMVRLAPIPTTVISYAMGAASARQVPYAIAVVGASIPQWLWVYCGATAVTSEATGFAKTIGIACSVTAALILSVWVPRRVLANLAGDVS